MVLDYFLVQEPYQFILKARKFQKDPKEMHYNEINSESQNFVVKSHAGGCAMRTSDSRKYFRICSKWASKITDSCKFSTLTAHFDVAS